MDERIRLRLDVSYDGTDFSGWAAQPDRRTVAGVLRRDAGPVLGAGRRDRADRGRAHRRRGARHRPGLPRGPARRRCGASTSGTLLRRLAGLLPAGRAGAGDDRGAGRLRRPVLGDLPPLRVPGDRRAVRAPSRCAATTRWPGRGRWTWTALNAAAAGLVGEHDFAAYCRRKEHATTHAGGHPAGLAPRPGRHPGRHRAGRRVLPGDGAQHTSPGPDRWTWPP